ncbi:MAG TPA: pitrilysin family protein [Bacillota bacterium]|jgi:predicted Zn-dependent peptidase
MNLQRCEYPALGETVYAATTGDGLRVYVMPKPGYHKKYATYATHYGSVDSHFRASGAAEATRVPDGIAHFLEHKLFEKPEGNVFDRFAELGAMTNAFTTYTSTSYLCSTTEKFPECLDLLVNFVRRPYFTDESVAKEKGIIGQEIRMYEDSPQWRVRDNLLTALYQRHPVRINIAGTVESIEGITKDLLYQCYGTFYRPDNMILFITGDVDPAWAIDHVVGRATVDRPAGPGGSAPEGGIERLFPDEPPSVNQHLIEEGMAVAVPLILVGFKDRDIGYDGPRLLEKTVYLETVLDGLLGRSSAIYESLYQDGLIDERFSFGYEGERDYGYVVVGGESPDPDRLRDRLAEALGRARTDGIDPATFERTRRKLSGGFIAGFNSPEFAAHNFTLFRFKDVDIFDYLTALERVDLDGANRRLREVLDPSAFAVSIIRPKDSPPGRRR